MTLRIDYSVMRAARTGFEGFISVTNTGRAALREWLVTFDFFDVTLVALDGADIVAETERIYTITPCLDAPALLPGGTATVRFTARGPAARVPVFIGDDDEDLEALDGGDGVLTFRTGHLPSPALTALLETDFGMPADPALLADTDGLVVADEAAGFPPFAAPPFAAPPVSRRDALVFHDGAVARVSDLVRLAIAGALPAPANENATPLPALVSTPRDDRLG